MSREAALSLRPMRLLDPTGTLVSLRICHGVAEKRIRVELLDIENPARGLTDERVVVIRVGTTAPGPC